MAWVRFPPDIQEFGEALHVRFGREFMSEGGRQCNDTVPSLRSAYNPTDTRRAVFIQKSGSGIIGCDHQIFDKKARTILLTYSQIQNNSPIGDDRIQLQIMKGKRALFM